MENFKCYQSLENFESGKFRIFYSVCCLERAQNNFHNFTEVVRQAGAQMLLLFLLLH